MDIPWAIPQHWRWVAMKDLGDIVSGGTPSTKESIFWGNEINWISPSDLTNYTKKFIANGAKSITQKGLKHSSAKLMPSGSIHFSSRAPIGYVAISSEPLSTNQGFKSLVPKVGVFNEYIYYYLKAARHLAEEKATGTTFKEISGRAFSILPVPLCPTNEQKRIVAKIDELFSKLDKGIENLKTAQALLKICRKTLLNNILKCAPETKALEQLLERKLQNGYSGKPVKYVSDYKVLSLSATTTGIFKDNCFKYLDEKGLTERDIWCEPDDILVQRGNTPEYVGVPAIYNGSPNMYIFPDLMIRIRANKSLIETKYLYYTLASEKIRNYFRVNAKGSAGTMPKINQSILLSAPIPYFPKSQQIQIINQIELQFSIFDNIDQIINENLIKSDTLRQSILQNAFSGKLVELEPDGEPISILLERLRIDKEGNKRVTMTSKRKPKHD